MAKKPSTVTARNVTSTSREVNQIGGNTQIVFTIKSFFTLIGTILGLFFGFYMLVVDPRIKKTEDNYNEMYKEQKTLNENFTKEITTIKLDMKPTSEIIEQNPVTETSLATTD